MIAIYPLQSWMINHLLMIKFFRKIRLRLITENLSTGRSQAGKFSKYLVYAMGELLLVILGIMIALQINNWNEQEKKRNLKPRY